MKKILVLLCAGFVYSAQAQNEIDVLRYSTINYLGGTARFTAMGGAFGALGGDFSAIGINPAGLGIYRKGEFTVSPGFFFNNTTSKYQGIEVYDSKFNMNFSNCGLVLANGEDGDEPEWKGIGLGIGYNRYNNFNSSVIMEGKNPNSSLLDVYAYSANQSGTDVNSLDPFGAQLAFNTYLLDTVTAGDYYSIIQNYGQNQIKTIDAKGNMGEMFFGIGGNYSNKLYIGMSMGLPQIRYTEETTFTEVVENDTTYNLTSYTMNTDLSTTGSGFNFKFGMIYKPFDFMRIGASVHTPTLFNMEDEWSSSITSHFVGSSYTALSPAGAYRYTLTTPVRATGSLGFVIQKFAAIALDYEYVDYSTARLKAPDYAFINENKAVRSKYTSTGNLRLGAEFKLKPISVRVGYGLFGSPYQKEVGNDGSRSSYSGGIGFRDNNTFVDVSYTYTTTKENYYFYDPSITSPSVNKSAASSVVLTMGIKF